MKEGMVRMALNLLVSEVHCHSWPGYHSMSRVQVLSEIFLYHPGEFFKTSLSPASALLFCASTFLFSPYSPILVWDIQQFHLAGIEFQIENLGEFFFRILKALLHCLITISVAIEKSKPILIFDLSNVNCFLFESFQGSLCSQVLECQGCALIWGYFPPRC